MLAPWKKSYDQPRQHIKKKRHYFADKGPSIQSYGFSSSPVWMWELDYKESWVLKNCCFWTVLLKKTLESPLDCKEIQPVHSKGDQSWDFFGRNDAKAETPILWLSAFFTVQLSHPYMTTGKTIALTSRNFVGKLMSLLLNMLSRLVITFLPRSKHLLISWLLSPYVFTLLGRYFFCESV